MTADATAGGAGEATTASRPVVIVPAHNEQAVLARGVTTMLAGAGPGEFEVVVVVNGSRDGTAAAARALREPLARRGLRLTVVELDEASKTAAIRAGAAHAPGRPQVVVDADVLLDTAVLRELTTRLRQDTGRHRVACPRVRVDTSGSSRLVRGYYRAWSALPYLAEATIGSGVFGVTDAGAERLAALPDVINDDGWVRRAFPPADRVTTAGSFTILAPRTVTALVRRRARIANGNRELAAEWGDDPGGNSLRALLAQARSGAVRWPDAAAFLAVTAAARAVAWWRRRTGNHRRWSVDHTSREGTAP